MKHVKHLILFALLFNLGCAYSSHFLNEGAQTYSETNWQEVELFAGDIDRDYEVIAAIASDAPGNSSKAEIKIKDEAAKIGADAVIFIKLTKMTSMTQRTGISGVAVKYLD
jgi:hypothetical protein